VIEFWGIVGDLEAFPSLLCRLEEIPYFETLKVFHEFE
jgi:hypothetical protein